MSRGYQHMDSMGACSLHVQRHFIFSCSGHSLRELRHNGLHGFFGPLPTIQKVQEYLFFKTDRDHVFKRYNNITDGHGLDFTTSNRIIKPAAAEQRARATELGPSRTTKYRAALSSTLSGTAAASTTGKHLSKSRTISNRQC